MDKLFPLFILVATFGGIFLLFYAALVSEPKKREGILLEIAHELKDKLPFKDWEGPEAYSAKTLMGSGEVSVRWKRPDAEAILSFTGVPAPGIIVKVRVREGGIAYPDVHVWPRKMVDFFSRFLLRLKGFKEMVFHDPIFDSIYYVCSKQPEECAVVLSPDVREKMALAGHAWLLIDKSGLHVCGSVGKAPNGNVLAGVILSLCDIQVAFSEQLNAARFQVKAEEKHGTNSSHIR